MALIVFLLALVGGYAVVLFAGLAIIEIAGISQFEGAAAMGVASFYAPIGALVIATLALRWYQRRNRPKA